MTDTPTPEEPHRTPEIDEVFRRIGRNLLLFQHIERLLKQLMAGARLEGTVNSLQAYGQESRARIHKQTLGQLVGQFVDDVLADAGERKAPENLDEAWFSFGFTIQTGSAFVEEHTAEMNSGRPSPTLASAFSHLLSTARLEDPPGETGSAWPSSAACRRRSHWRSLGRGGFVSGADRYDCPRINDRTVSSGAS